jgi:hypothetical protein
MPNPEEDRHPNRSEKSPFKPVESDQFQIGPRTAFFCGKFRSRSSSATVAPCSAKRRAVA